MSRSQVKVQGYELFCHQSPMALFLASYKGEISAICDVRALSYTADHAAGQYVSLLVTISQIYIAKESINELEQWRQKQYKSEGPIWRAWEREPIMEVWGQSSQGAQGQASPEAERLKAF